MSDWKYEPFERVIADESGGNRKTPQSEFLPLGRYAIVDQGKDLVAGYTNDESRLCRAHLPVIVFGDHTRCFKYVDFPFCMGADGVKVLRPLVDADVKYLYHYFRQLRLTEGGYGRHFKYLKRCTIALPPLPEQRRIAEILDKVDALRAKRRGTITHLAALAQSIFLDMFGDADTNLKGLRKSALGELIRLKSGRFLPASDLAPGGAFPVLGGNGINGHHDRYMFAEPQIVIGRVGVYCGCVHAAPPKSWITDNALYVSERVPELKFEYLVHALTNANLNQYASQSGQPLISGSRVYPVEILVPPEDLQDSFGELIARVTRLERLVDTGRSELDRLFASLQHRAFRGEL